MCAPDATVYPLLVQLVQTMLGPGHVATLSVIPALVWSLLQCQSLHVAELARNLPDGRSGSARQAMRRVRRLLGRASLSSARLTPVLIRTALRCVDERCAILVLDTTRCRRWELFTLGIRCGGGRVLPVAWAVLAYPWPRGQFTPTAIALIEQVLQQWPPTRPVHLLADRGFPSRKLFVCLQSWRRRRCLDYTIRLRARDYVWLPNGQHYKVGDCYASLPMQGWLAEPASYLKGERGRAGTFLVVGREDVAPPAHQRGPADQARRAARAAQRAAHLRSKRQPQTATTDRVWALLTTLAVPSAAAATYRLRFATEGSYRDLKSWHLESVVAHESDPQHLDGLLGLAALALLIQALLGAAASRTSDLEVRRRQLLWSTTDRLSLFCRGRLLLHDRAFDWQPWLVATLGDLCARLAPREPQLPQQPLPSPPPLQEAA